MLQSKKQKRLTNKMLVKYLMDVSLFDMISIDAKHVICTCSSKFRPVHVNQLIEGTGHQDIKMTVDGSNNFIVFKRF